MRAVRIDRFGDPSGMVVVDTDVPEPGHGQVVIETEAIGVGGVDAVIRRGTLRSYGFAEGLIPGSEVAGTITATGPDVEPDWLGRRVWAFTGVGGGYVERATASIGQVVELPESLTSVAAVSLGSAAPVAHFALRHAQFEAGESVLVRGAAGSIGIATVQLAARGGAGAVAVTTSSADRGERLRELGATHVLDRAGHGNPHSPAAYDVVIDIIAGPDLPTYVERLAPNGRMVVVGAVAGPPPADFGMRFFGAFQRSLSFSTFSLATVPPTAIEAARRKLFAAAARGELAIVVHDVMPLADAAEAHRLMDAGAVFGRIVLVP